MLDRVRTSRKRKSRTRTPESNDKRQRSNLNCATSEEEKGFSELQEEALAFLAKHPDSPRLDYLMSPINYEQGTEGEQDLELSRKFADLVISEIEDVHADSSSEDLRMNNDQRYSSESVEIYTGPIDISSIIHTPVDDRSSSESLSALPGQRLFAIITTDRNDAELNYFDSFRVFPHDNAESLTSETRDMLLEAERSGTSTGLPRMREISRFVGEIDNHPLPHRFNGRMHSSTSQTAAYKSVVHAAIEGHFDDV